MLLKLITACLFACVVGVGATTTFNNDLNNDNEISIRQENKKLANYNDTNLTITLSLDELSYTYNNLNNVICDNELTEYIVNFTYDDIDFLYWQPLQGYSDNFPTGLFDDLGDDGRFGYFYVYYGTQIENVTQYGFNIAYDYFNDEYVNKFYIRDNATDEFSNFESEISFTVNNQANYTLIKNAIELDIQANTQPFMLPVLQEVVSLLTSGISALAVGIGGGVSILVSAIFISNGALSPFGAIIIVFSGIALAIGLSRWVMNFLTSLGAKK